MGLRIQRLYQVIASTLMALEECRRSGNSEWASKHRDRLYDIEQNLLPRGSGLDAGCTIVATPSRAGLSRREFIIHTSFHHMDPNGFYDGWTDHDIKVFPAWDGLDILVKGQNRNSIKEYLAQVFEYNLNLEVVWDEAKDRYVQVEHSSVPVYKEPLASVIEDLSKPHAVIHAMAVRYNNRVELSWFFDADARDTHYQFSKQVHRDGFLDVTSFTVRVKEEEFEASKCHIYVTEEYKRVAHTIGVLYDEQKTRNRVEAAGTDNQPDRTAGDSATGPKHSPTDEDTPPAL